MKKLTFIFMSIFTLGAMTFTSCSKKEGCTDPVATNFDADAQKDDGSCIYDNTEDPVVDDVKSKILVNFTFNFDGVPVSLANLNQFNYVTQDNDTISIAKIRYLISDLSLYKSNGDSVHLDDYQLVDLSIPTSMSFTTGEVDLGAYASVGFKWGFDSVDNQGNYVDLNSTSWNWPAMIGGGYHFMQFDGQYLNNGTPSPFNFHNGTASNGGVHEDNHAEIRLAGIALNQEYVSLEIRMNIAEWFKNPHTWDLNVYNTMLMPNYTAQKLMHDQVYSVFSLGTISQRQ